MKKFRRNFLKILIIKTIFLFTLNKSFSNEIKIQKKRINKKIYKKFIWYLDENDK